MSNTTQFNAGDKVEYLEMGYHYDENNEIVDYTINAYGTILTPAHGNESVVVFFNSQIDENKKNPSQFLDPNIQHLHSTEYLKKL